MDVLELDGRADDVEQPRLDADLHAERLHVADDRRAGARCRGRRSRRSRGATSWVRTERLEQRARLVRRAAARSSGIERTTSALSAQPCWSFSRTRGRRSGSPTTMQRSGSACLTADAADERPADRRRRARTRPTAPTPCSGAEMRPSTNAPWREEDDERVERREVEEARALVERRLREDDLVAVVQPHQPAGHDDQRQDQQAGRVQRVLADQPARRRPSRPAPRRRRRAPSSRRSAASRSRDDDRARCPRRCRCPSAARVRLRTGACPARAKRPPLTGRSRNAVEVRTTRSSQTPSLSPRRTVV